jgi:hypothetical protein
MWVPKFFHPCRGLFMGSTLDQDRVEEAQGREKIGKSTQAKLLISLDKSIVSLS